MNETPVGSSRPATRAALTLAALVAACVGEIPASTGNGEPAGSNERSGAGAARSSGADGSAILPGASEGMGPSAAPFDPAQPPPSSNGCAADSSAATRPRLWRLDAEQYGKTVATLFSGRSTQGNGDLRPPSGIVLPLEVQVTAGAMFSTAAGSRRLLPDQIDSVVRAAYELSERLLARAAIAACVQGAGRLAACLEQPLLQIAELLFRRRLGAADIAPYLTMVTAAEASEGRAEAARLALEGLLVSPRFLFRSEQGSGQGTQVPLDSFEIAEALSYSLTDAPPDQTLWTDAVNGALTGGAVIERHVARLLAAADERGPLPRFVRELFGYDETEGIAKAQSFHRPDALVAEADLFVGNVLQAAAHKDFVRALLTSRNGFASAATAKSYSLSLSGSSTTAQPVTFTGERQGLLGHPAWLSSNSQPERTDPVKRGRFVYERFLCGSIPNVDINTVPPIPADRTRTLRDKFVAHTKDPSCRVCHQFMDDVGLALEGFDDYGRARDVEAGRPVDRSGTLRGSDQDGAFVGLDGLVGKLLASQQVARCFASRVFESFMGRPAELADACAVHDAVGRYQKSGGDLAALVQAFFVSDRFLRRTR